MALQGAALPTGISPLGRNTVLTQLHSARGLRLGADKYALRSAFVNGGGLMLNGAAASRISMRVASKQAYICRDCGYIYNERTPFEKLPDKFFCPVCGAPKRRFRPYDVPVAKNANEASVRKARKEELKKEAAIGNILPVAIVIGVAGLAATYFYLNSQF